MESTKILAVILLFALSLLLTGCGGGAEVMATSTTMGQELSDLQQAKDKGVITDKEFEKAKKKIMERY